MLGSNAHLKCPKTLIGVDIFSGAGGLSLGAKMCGIDVKYAIEMCPSAAATYRTNHPQATVFNEDICAIDPQKAIQAKDSNIFVIMGGPPCQGFSMSNRRDRNMENPKNHLFKQFVRFVDKLKPTWFVFENVAGIINMEGGNTIRHIMRCFSNIGYTLSSPQLLWANDYGVPQKRNRFFLVGNREGISFEFPKPSGKIITVADAISDLPRLVNGETIEIGEYSLPLRDCSEYAKFMRTNSKYPTQNNVSKNNELVLKRYRYIKQGGNWQDIPARLMENYADKNRCHSGIYKRLKASEPSVVISNYRKMMLIHPTQDRGLSIREAARLQSFPDDFYFEGSISYIQQQIGNAVPPLLSKAIFEQILSYYKK